MLLIQRKKKSEQAGKGKAYVTNSKKKKIRTGWKGFG